jgi:hypothetical protein
LQTKGVTGKPTIGFCKSVSCKASNNKWEYLSSTTGKFARKKTQDHKTKKYRETERKREGEMSISRR